jgi:hypothetical protein
MRWDWRITTFPRIRAYIQITAHRRKTMRFWFFHVIRAEGFFQESITDFLKGYALT